MRGPARTLAGCVSEARYDQAVQDARAAREDAQRVQAGMDERVRLDNQRIDALSADVARHNKMV
ncbi:MAG TPA: hypothetical protein VMB05_12815, partial [Solirubrobacteraceae bacterium]|nr:hypothetical protein [Solirubrobacteraceae bacterium]